MCMSVFTFGDNKIIRIKSIPYNSFWYMHNFFFKIKFLENNFSRDTIRVTNSLDSDQARHFVMVLACDKLGSGSEFVHYTHIWPRNAQRAWDDKI